MKLSRPSFEDIYMEMAESLSRRSTCSRLSVGTVLTSPDFTRVISLGYNGSYAGGPNECDRNEPGNCGCLHSEINALIKADTRNDFFAFITHQPCASCAKALVNAGCKRVYFKNKYRNPEGVEILFRAGIMVVHMENNG